MTKKELTKYANKWDVTTAYSGKTKTMFLSGKYATNLLLQVKNEVSFNLKIN
jgi:hypothetical protein